MKKISITVLPEFYDRYINETDDLDLSVALESYSVSLIIEDKDKLISLGNKVYERDKWTVKDILQHLIDCERIFCYRALRIARNDKGIFDWRKFDFKKRESEFYYKQYTG